MGRWRTPACVLSGVALLLGLVTGCSGGERTSSGPLRIGVMLPLSGPDAVGARRPLEWARANVNAAGGVDGRRIQLVYRDLDHRSAVSVAESFAADPSVAAVIGPANSEDAQQVASVLVDHHEVMVTPSATSADLFRAFSNHHPQYVWRPVESDIAQMRTMLDVASEGGARAVALVTGDSAYGTTFFDSFGFLATEDGLRVTTTVRYDQDAEQCEEPLDRALASGADVVLAVPDHASQAVCMAREWRARGSRPRLLLSDAAEDPSLTSALGPSAEGLEGIGLAPDPTNGFAQAFRARFGRLPTPYAANLYDSVLLVAYGLARARGDTGASLAKAIGSVVDGRGAPVEWNRAGVADALRAIRAGHLPTVRGAVGPWQFDTTSGLELVASTYEHWQVDAGQFSAIGYRSTASSPTALHDVSESRTTATPANANATIGGDYEPGPKTGTWALLVAASDGWANYRHQADVMAQYRRLRANGVPADHIVVVSAGDLTHHRRNPAPGEVPYTVGGPDLSRGFHADYPLRGMTAERLMAILSGDASPDTPTVIRSGPGDDVFVYLVGHGNENGLYLGLGEPVPSDAGSYSVLTPQLLGRTVDEMATEREYRRILVAVDACKSGAFGAGLRAPGALLLAAASPVENSLSSGWDARRRTWLADQFSFQLWKAEKTPDVSIDRLYEKLYLGVAGSHVSAYGPAFGDAATVSLGEFLTP